MELQVKPKSKKWKGNFGLYFSLPILSWAFYDFANTIFSSNINTIFFPFFLQEQIGENAVLDQIASTFISYANAIASLFLVLFSPLFGVMIDRTGKMKKYIMIFTLISVVCTFLMGVFGGMSLDGKILGIPVSLAIVILLFVIAKFFYHSSLVFYDTMMSDLGTKQQLPLISGFGVAVGYLGTLVGLSIYPFISKGSSHEAFIPTAILFLVFSLPLFFFLKESPKQQKAKEPFLSGYKEIKSTFKEMRSYRSVFTFMIAYFFLNDAIATTIGMMAVYAKTVVGFSSSGFILLYLVSTVSSIAGSFLFGYVTQSKGPRLAVTYVGVLLLVALFIAVFAQTALWFWVAGSMFGISLGSMWVTSRTYIIELTPDEKRGQFFGLFAFSGKVSSIIGPLLYGTITLIFHDLGTLASRMALGSLIIMAIIGLGFLLKLKGLEEVK
ncbi:MFS transporter [Peribacillus castrilensis]|uniref:MFS sugar transporter superfamily protein n=1 Tax=Peribacillus simplex TaxID=1478 RepID=A0AAN2PGB3_9BACI|nr:MULTISPECIES: MFS transporter [Bacillaceae]MCP1093563.1 MFS transporter [Bacillaceae bacterium OS4b]MBD8590969.1 MFS transporter [Peribacillus simplex]MCF7621500.1 MFS transporter [Peribacillus frigoritolerans]MCP1152156.1 MFS transporter [Peribacillus frigoritolerans]MCT1389587.1 MFS transporter [Peribacillus frigoritolerans]